MAGFIGIVNWFTPHPSRFHRDTLSRACWRGEGKKIFAPGEY